MMAQEERMLNDELNGAPPDVALSDDVLVMQTTEIHSFTHLPTD